MAPPDRSHTAPAPQPPTFAAFALRLLLYLFVVSLLFSVGGLHQRLGPMQRLIAWGVSACTNALGAHAAVSDTVIQLDQAALEINHECTGVFVLLVYATFVLAYPAPWSLRLTGILTGIVVLMAVNFARLVALSVIAAERPEWFGYFHEYFFQGAFIALLAFMASVWTERVRRATIGHLSA